MRDAILIIFALFFIVQFSYAQLESLDIGDARNIPGSTEFEDGKYTIEGGGSDIWEAADGFRFAYTKVNGNFETKVRQLSIELGNEWAKGGLHARQSLDPDAANAQAIVTGGGGGGCQLTWRLDKGGASSEFMDIAPGPWKDIECWLKLTRDGNEFHGYISEDGKDWKDLQSVEVKMTNPVYVGLAVCGMDQIGKGVYDNFGITQNGREVFPGAVESSEKFSITWGKIKHN